MAKRTTRIIQIIPATGWICVYRDGETNVESEAACFALHEDGEIVLMDIGSDGYVAPADEASNFIRCYFKAFRIEAEVSGGIDTYPQ
jgi:hypothetical protein